MKANLIALIAAVAGVGTMSHAALHTFDSALATPVSYTSSANWTGGVPATAPLPPGEDVLINTGIAEFTPGGDFRVNATFTVASGATFQQLPGNGAWMKIADGNNTSATLNVNGTFTGPATVGSNLFLGNGNDTTVSATVTGSLSGANILLGTGTNSVATVNVNGGQINAGNELRISTGSSLTVSGATGSASGALLQVNQGTFELKNGAQSSFTNVTLNSGSTFKLNGASFTKTGNLLVDVGRTLVVQGASVLNVTGELKPVGGTTTIAGGTVNTSLISFDGVADTLDLSGGRINISGTFTDGIFTSSADKYVDYTLASTGEIFLSNGTVGNANALLAAGKIRYLGVIDAAAFNVTPVQGGGVLITAVAAAAVPEPATMGLLGVAAVGLLGRRRK